MWFGTFQWDENCPLKPYQLTMPFTCRSMHHNTLMHHTHRATAQALEWDQLQGIAGMYILLWFSLSLSLYFTFLFSFHSIPFGPFFPSIPTSLIHEALLVSLIYDSQALRLTSSSIPILPYTARHCLMTRTDYLSPWGCASPLFPFCLTSYDLTLIFYQTTLCPIIYI